MRRKSRCFLCDLHVYPGFPRWGKPRGLAGNVVPWRQFWMVKCEGRHGKCLQSAYFYVIRAWGATTSRLC